ncbi:hypothetical protein [Chitinophaga ginsengisoli]|uniref:Uncharacterized protein n=1 Tax=Chitinophaga ginsengisoli TaxID=363837 RepID=A0A2P8FDW5_9BACT|nr:hypothetical protein [Chitinophaga ginsengisoli]PSL19903.1 hypothetical protein CLV42_12615 [Chitinophaga ginsengisoli]
MHTFDYLKAHRVAIQAAVGLTFKQLMLAHENYVNGSLNRQNNFERVKHIGITRTQNGFPLPYIYTTRGKLLYPKE